MTADRITYACYDCGNHIDGDEVKRRTRHGWMPFHPLCDPGPDAVEREGGFLLRSSCTIWDYQSAHLVRLPKAPPHD